MEEISVRGGSWWLERRGEKKKEKKKKGRERKIKMRGRSLPWIKFDPRHTETASLCARGRARMYAVDRDEKNLNIACAHPVQEGSCGFSKGDEGRTYPNREG